MVDAFERLYGRAVFGSNECWLFTGSKDSGGYGNIYYEGSLLKAHRLSWLLFNGNIPIGLWVLHECDTPACINPAHLFLGTRQDNIEDQKSKGRWPNRQGINNGHVALSENQVKEILILLDLKELTQSEIGAKYNIAQSTVSYIKRVGWQHLKKEIENANLDI